MPNLLLHEVENEPVVTLDGETPRSLHWVNGAWRHDPVMGLKALAAGHEIGEVRFLSRHPAAACALPLALETLAARYRTSLKIR